MIELTTAYHEINLLKNRFRVIQGGQGAGKTYSILIKIVARCLKEKIKATIVTDTYPSLKDGVISDTKSIVTELGINWERDYNKSDKNIFFSNGSIIQFRNADSNNFQQLKGVRRDVLFINEANKTGWLTVDQMITRSKIVYIDYNPDAEFWVHEHILNRDNIDFISLNYTHNEKISDEEKAEIELRIKQSKEPDASSELKQWVQVYAYGELGTYSTRRIYSYKWIDKIPETATKVISAMDFGVSPDPTILIDMFVENNNIYIDERFCENNLMPEKIKGAERMSVVDKMDELKIDKGWHIIGDSSGRSTILDLINNGYNIIGVKKKPGSVISGIKDVRGYNLFITKRSINMKKGFESWFFKVDHNGKIIPEPEGHEPDGLAALRYGVMAKSLW